MSADYEPSKYLKRKLQDILDSSEDDIAFAAKTILTRQVEHSKDLLKEKEIILGTEVLDEAIKLHKSKKAGIRGLSSGFNSIDRLTKGFVPGEVTIIAARTSVGKTSLAMAIAANVAKAGHPILFMTLEMTQAQLMERYIEYTGGLEKDYPTDMFMDIAALTFMQKHEKVTPDSIEGIIKNASEAGSQLVILDHLHYFSRGTKTDDVEIISMELSRTAKKYKLPIIAIAHVRKNPVVGGKPKDTSMDDIRGASFISQDADIVLILNRYKTEPNDLRVTVWKNRNGGIDYSQNEYTMDIQGSVIKEGWV